MTLSESCIPPPPTRHAPPAALLRAQGLHNRFGGVEAVRDISLAVWPGQVLAIIGPNGAGKSTLLNLLSGLYQPDAGEMSFDGVKLVGLPAHRRARLGLARTFQKIRLFRGVSVLDNVIAAFHTRHDIPPWQYVVHAAAFERDRARCREEALRLLAFVGLEQRADLPAASLAYGEQRMLELAPGPAGLAAPAQGRRARCGAQRRGSGATDRAHSPAAAARDDRHCGRA